MTTHFIPHSTKHRMPSLPLMHRGVSLVELMVAMAIGLVVVGAVFTNFINNAAGARQTAAMTQVTSDAAIALGILRNHIAIAGYGNPTNTNNTSGLQTTFSAGNAGLFGCDHSFTEATRTNEIVTTLECNAPPGAGATSQGSALVVRYETDTSISPDTSVEGQAGTFPSDCVGNGIVLPPGTPPGTPTVAESRFRVKAANGNNPPSLTCAGNGNGGPVEADLVDNVVQMRVTYGIGDTPDATGKSTRVVRYVPASSISEPDNTNPEWQTPWTRVLSARVCIVVRSQEQVLPAATRYLDCDQVDQPAPDRRIYRSFTTTVLLNNRLSTEALNLERQPQ